MASYSLPELSPEQEHAHKIAARELAKYCQEFSRWRRRKQDIVVVDKSLRARGMLVMPPTKKPDSSVPSSSV